MRKFFLFICIAGLVWGGYEALSLATYIGEDDRAIGSIQIYDRGEKRLALLPKSHGYREPYTGLLAIPLIRSILDIEDKRYAEHSGIDIVGKIGALRENYRAGTIVRGGSTITEQYIKNRYFADASRTWEQKLREAGYALVLEMKYSKDAILRKYLDSVYMGNNLYGIESALRIYFSGKDPEKLTEDEIIEIITRIHSPSLTGGSEEYAQKISERLSYKIGISSFPKRERGEYTNMFPFFTSRILSEIQAYCSGGDSKLERYVREVPRDICTSGSTVLHTSLDMDLSLFTRDIMESILSPLESKNIHNAAVYIYSEKEKKVLAYIGNRKNTQDNAVDMITRRRSVGSILKPILYKLVFQGGADGESYILDDTRVYETEDTTKQYLPENYIPKSYGPIRLREALGNSLNSAAVRLSESLGIGHIYDTFRSYGLDLDHEVSHYGYGIALGTPELTLENVIEGYTFLTDLSEKENSILYRVLSDGRNRARTFGVSSILNTSVPLAVKTGTSTDFRDNWAIGYNSDIIIGIWVGNTDGRSMDDVSGVSGAGPLYHQIAEYMIEKGYISSDIPPVPPGLHEDYICLDIGCFQKEKGLLQDGHVVRSHPRDKKYFASDFVTSMTTEEMKKWKIE